jgi:hypothetical protein
MEGTGSTIEVNAKFFPLAFLLYLTKPKIEIDGAANEGSWGTNRFDVTPGRHNVKVSFRYLWMPECGANSIDVDAPPGGTTRLKYNMPPWMLAKGSLKTDP